MKNSFRNWLSQWDQGNFDFSKEMVKDMHRPVPKSKENQSWKHEELMNLERKEVLLFNKVYPILSVAFAIVMVVFMLMVVIDMPQFADNGSPANNNDVVERYIEKGLEETGAVNIVAGVILDYRAFDTLGESHVLYVAAMVVTSLLLLAAPHKEPAYEAKILQKDPILKYTAMVLVPLVIMFGAYVILCGHLGPGGGFSGGSVIGGALILYAYAFGHDSVNRLINKKSYSLIVLCALSFYALAKCYSFFCGANHLESIFKPGVPGQIFSAGLILPLNVAVGVVVACTMYGFYAYFTRGQI